MMNIRLLIFCCKASDGLTRKRKKENWKVGQSRGSTVKRRIERFPYTKMKRFQNKKAKFAKSTKEKWTKEGWLVYNIRNNMQKDTSNYAKMILRTTSKITAHKNAKKQFLDTLQRLFLTAIKGNLGCTLQSRKEAKFPPSWAFKFYKFKPAYLCENSFLICKTLQECCVGWVTRLVSKASN